MATLKGNVQVAKNRGAEWNKNLIKGKLEAQLYPTVLKTARIKKTVSQSELAKLLKISLATYGSIERGKRSASSKVAIELSKRLGGTISAFFKPVKSGRYLAIVLK